MNTEIKLTKKQEQKKIKIEEWLKSSWELLEETNNIWSYKFNDYHKNTEGLIHLYVRLEITKKVSDRKSYELTLIEENEEITERDYKLVIGENTLIRDLMSEVGGLIYKMERSRDNWQRKVAEKKRLDELQQLGFISYIEKAIAEKFIDEEEYDDERKLRNQKYREVAKELLLKYQWQAGSYISKIYKEIGSIENDWDGYFDWSSLRSFIEDIRQDWWELNKTAFEKAIEELSVSQFDKYQQLISDYRDNKISTKDFYNELGKDIVKVNSNYSNEDLGEYYGENFLKEQIEIFAQKEIENRKSWNQQQWKDYFPRGDWGKYEEVRVSELNLFELKRFLGGDYSSKQFEEWKDLNKGNYGDLSNREVVGKMFDDYDKQIRIRFKEIIDGIKVGKDFVFRCEYCCEVNKEVNFKKVGETKHNLIYTCSYCENTDYYVGKNSNE